MSSTWILFVLAVMTCAECGKNPVMRYRFCPSSDPVCEPTKFASNSTIEFGVSGSGLYLVELKITLPSLSVSCAFDEPLHWILSAHWVQVKGISTNVTRSNNGSRLLYYYHINMHEVGPGMIRCESYEDRNTAAEIYIAFEAKDNHYALPDAFIFTLIPTAPRYDGQLIVPCEIRVSTA